MANDLPADVRRDMEASGVKFDEEGNIIEEEKFIEDQVEDEDQEDEIEDETDDSKDEADDETSEDLSDDDPDEDDEDEVEDEPPVKKKLTKKKAKKTVEEKPKLTPKAKAEEKPSVDTSELVRKIEELQAKLEKPQVKDSKTDSKTAMQSTIEDDLREEIAQFRKERMLTLARTLKSDVNNKLSGNGITYDEVINSSEWDTFLSTVKYGKPIGDHYRKSIQDGDYEAMVGFFDDFKSIYIPDQPEQEESTTDKVKPSLDDLVVPEKTKSNKAPKRKTKFDFNESDYATKLNEFERGKMDYESFYKFEQKFQKALSEGRVKPD